MTRDQVRKTIQTELGAILDSDDLHLEDGTRAQDVVGWDSLTHLKLLVALEAAFGVKFQLLEMNASANVGELVDLILSKQAS